MEINLRCPECQRRVPEHQRRVPLSREACMCGWIQPDLGKELIEKAERQRKRKLMTPVIIRGYDLPWEVGIITRISRNPCIDCGDSCEEDEYGEPCEYEHYKGQEHYTITSVQTQHSKRFIVRTVERGRDFLPFEDLSEPNLWRLVDYSKRKKIGRELLEELAEKICAKGRSAFPEIHLGGKDRRGETVQILEGWYRGLVGKISDPILTHNGTTWYAVLVDTIEKTYSVDCTYPDDSLSSVISEELFIARIWKNLIDEIIPEASRRRHSSIEPVKRFFSKLPVKLQKRFFDHYCKLFDFLTGKTGQVPKLPQSPEVTPPTTRPSRLWQFGKRDWQNELEIAYRLQPDLGASLILKVRKASASGR